MAEKLFPLVIVLLSSICVLGFTNTIYLCKMDARIRWTEHRDGFRIEFEGLGDVLPRRSAGAARYEPKVFDMSIGGPHHGINR
ncbi:hypothetical protein [Nocardia bhagyanarayanae]|uniref:hypothetical protein n=1 Tax=Nocardia bhagyanarayanae TaxID=1215925 RepID=UPI00163AFF53|nr:hypothetical protein [Nocardia bhagyanarayanae]